MRIISKFNDYYDIGMGLGHDPSLIYVRECMEIDFKLPDTDEQIAETRKLFKRFPTLTLTRNVAVRYEIIGFCGKFYPVIIFPEGSNSLKYPQELCYSTEEVDSVLLKRLSPKEFQMWTNPSYPNYRSYRLGYYNRKKLEEFFKECKAVEDLNPFIVNRSPIVALNSGNGAIWNPRLRDYNFARIISPYEAFQEIEMFIGNLAVPEKPIPPRTDIEKLQSHGFDKKESFRKGKEI